MKYILNLLFIFFMGCAGYVDHIDMYDGRRGEVYKVEIDKSFSDKEVMEIRKSIRLWNYAMNGYVIIEEGLGGWRVMLGEEWDRKNAIAWANRIGGNRIYVVRSRLRGNLKEVMMHEIGHLVGLEHGEGLMYWMYGSSYGCIDKETMRRVGEILGVGVDRLNYC